MSDQKASRDNNKLKALAILAVLAIGVFSATLVASQALSKASAQTNEDDNDERPTISTSGTATTKVNPDKVSLTVGVETDGATASEAVAKNTALMNKVIAALKDLGLTDDQLSTGYFSVYPVYEYQYPPCILSQGAEGGMSQGSGSSTVRPDIYPPPPECQPSNVITGYKASNSLTVTADGNADVGKIIDAAVGAGANNVGGAYFFVSQDMQEQIREGLIQKAIVNAKSRADKAATAADVNITGVKSINLNDAYFPAYYAKESAASGVAGTPILPGEQEISMTVQVTYFIG